MIDWLQEELKRQPQLHLKRLAASELLQHLTLQSLYAQGAFKHLVFTGGTALRLLYHTARYSEDMDFSLVAAKDFRFRTTLEKVRGDMVRQNLTMEIHAKKEEKTVAKADLRFPGLLKELNLSPLKSEKLTLKVEIDKRPPAGGAPEIALVTEPISYTVAAFDLPSLFAAKLHALFFRGWIKGRDYYDLAWFLGKGVIPNFKLLNNAIRRTQGKGHGIMPREFKQRILKHLKTVDFKRVRAEVERFLIRPEESAFLALQPIESLLRNYS